MVEIRVKFGSHRLTASLGGALRDMQFASTAHMPRKPIEKSTIYPYSITGRCNNREWFELPLDQVYAIFIEVILKTKDQYNVDFEIFVLMQNHFHMIVTTPDGNISEAMRYFMTEVSRRIARATGRINRIFGQRYHPTIIKSSYHYALAFKYIARNPVVVHAANGVESYRWSSLNLQNNFLKYTSENRNGFCELVRAGDSQTMIWLNIEFDLATHEAISFALRRPVFEDPKIRDTRKVLSSLKDLEK